MKMQHIAIGDGSLEKAAKVKDSKHESSMFSKVTDALVQFQGDQRLPSNWDGL